MTSPTVSQTVKQSEQSEQQCAKRILVALDFPTAQQALECAQQLAPLGVRFKVGMELFYAEGVSVIQQIQALTPEPVFVDLKLHDIPNTVKSASQSLVRHCIQFFNVHCSGGPAMMSAAREGANFAAKELGLPKPVVIGVTVLTSMDEQTLKTHFQTEQSVQAMVIHWAKAAKASGLDGVVCSPLEASLIREACGSDFLLVTPGVRPAAQKGSDDQSRVLTPRHAIENGSDLLVIGRPITQAENPLAAAREIIASLQSDSV